MNINESCNMLNIDICDLSFRLVKQQYYKMALLTHPDKLTPSSSYDISFSSVKEAHDVLIDFLLSSNFNTTSQQHTSYNYDPSYNYDFEFILEYLFSRIYNKFNKSIDILKHLKTINTTQLKNLKQFLFNIKHTLPTDIYNFLYNSHSQPLHYIYPSFYDLMQHNIFILNLHDSKYYIPTWHKEIFFDNITVISSPSLPNYINIDQFNNIHVFISQDIQLIIDTSFSTPCNLPYIKSYSNNSVIMYLHDFSYEFNLSKIHIKKKQIIKLPNKGIPTIFNSNIYSNKYISNLVIHLSLF